MSDYEQERRAFWDAAFRSGPPRLQMSGGIQAVCQTLCSVEERAVHADNALRERDSRFNPPPTKEAAPEQDELAPCPVCGLKPTFIGEQGTLTIGVYYCAHSNTEQASLGIAPLQTRTISECHARAAWNSMRRKP